MEYIQAVGTIAYRYGYIIDSKREIVQQLCACSTLHGNEIWPIRKKWGATSV